MAFHVAILDFTRAHTHGYLRTLSLTIICVVLLLQAEYERHFKGDDCSTEIEHQHQEQQQQQPRWQERNRCRRRRCEVGTIQQRCKGHRSCSSSAQLVLGDKQEDPDDKSGPRYSDSALCTFVEDRFDARWSYQSCRLHHDFHHSSPFTITSTTHQRHHHCHHHHSHPHPLHLTATDQILYPTRTQVLPLFTNPPQLRWCTSSYFRRSWPKRGG
jgi:hypothetical protein